MNIKSFLVKQPGNVQYMVLDSVFNNNHYACAIGVGDLSDGEPRLTEVGAGAMNALAEYTKNFDSNDFFFVEITSQLKAKQRVPLAFANAKPNSAIYFICKDDKVYDFVATLLAIQQYSPYDASTH